ncbi:MAG: HAD-IA family hydrolase [Gemmatimonadetes bacterium]|nr:HAD-IA family hydrolase [Gemmatimonadota bacterium]
MLKAVLWDVDGTIAETERDGHRVAFNEAFEAHGIPWRWSAEHYGELLVVAGGRERLLHDMASRPDAPADSAAREALARTLHGARGVPMAITTTTSRANIDALFSQHLGAAWRDWFAVVLGGEDVTHKKPDPEVYQRALQLLGVEAHEAVAIEDSPAGVASARGAGVPVVVARSIYFTDTPIEGATAVGPGLHTRRGWTPALVPDDDASDGDEQVTLDDLARWCTSTR